MPFKAPHLLPLPRSARVFLALVPFVLSFVRDWKGFLFFGAPRKMTAKGHQQRATAIRETMGKLGPSFIKGAQVLAQREDIIMPVYARELRKLQDRVPPFSSKVAQRIIEKNLGKPISKLFERFEQRPIAAASLGQVHEATYKGQHVAVKVLRPGVEELVRTDLKAVYLLLFILKIFLDENLVRSFYAIVEEYQRMILQEMDFRIERRNAERIRKNFKDDPRIRIPRFLDATRQVALLEFIEGVTITDVQGLKAIGVDGRNVINLLVETYVRMAVIHGFIHADPHPGNLRIDAQKRLVILDYGMALEFDEFTRIELLRMVYAVTKRDVETIVDGFQKLGMVDPDINRGILRDAAQTLLDIQLDKDLTPRQIQEIAQEIIDTFYKFPLRLPNQLVYLFRASSLVEGIAIQYDPMFNGVKEATPIVKKMLAEIAFRGDKPIKDRVIDGAKETFITIRELAVVIHRLEREQLRLRIHEADIYGLERFLNALLRRLIIALALSVLMIALTIATYGTNMLALLLVGLTLLTLIMFSLALIPIPRNSGQNGPYLK